MMYFPLSMNHTFHQKQLSTNLHFGHFPRIPVPHSEFPRKNAGSIKRVGQLGLDGKEKMPRDSEGYPFQPFPISIKLIMGSKIIEVSCGDAHTLALTNDGKIFSFGGIKI